MNSSIFKTEGFKAFTRVGFPMIAMVVGGSYLLSYLTQVRYDLDKNHQSALTKFGDVHEKKEFNIKEEYEKYQKDNWDWKPIPPPK